jgi:hypothetical protein
MPDTDPAGERRSAVLALRAGGALGFVGAAVFTLKALPSNGRD